MDVLQDAEPVLGDGETEALLEAGVPRLGQVGSRERPREQLLLDLAKLVDELADPVVDEPLVCGPLERRLAVGADGRACGRHHHHLIPVQQRQRRTEIGYLPQPTLQLGESLVHRFLLSAGDDREPTCNRAAGERGKLYPRGVRTTAVGSNAPPRQMRVSISISSGVQRMT